MFVSNFDILDFHFEFYSWGNFKGRRMIKKNDKWNDKRAKYSNLMHTLSLWFTTCESFFHTWFNFWMFEFSNFVNCFKLTSFCEFYRTLNELHQIHFNTFFALQKLLAALWIGVNLTVSKSTEKRVFFCVHKMRFCQLPIQQLNTFQWIVNDFLS